VHPRDREAIAALLARGVPVSLCTGRMYSGTRETARLLELDGPVGCVDGSHIVEAGSHRELCAHPISRAGGLVEILAEFETVSFVFSGDVIHHDARGAEFLHYVSLWSEQAVELEVVLERARWSEDPAVAAIVSLGTEDQIRGARTVIEGELGGVVQAATFEIQRARVSGGWGMVVRAAGVDKGTAIEWIARHHGVDPCEVVVVGDWLNDVPMMKAAGRSFAMAQSPAAVKAAATDVLDADTWSGGGIAEAAERAGLL
jgi:hydroxymethylpyrimidine pyrophosphatase-like HAD family hydrolase